MVSQKRKRTRGSSRFESDHAVKKIKPWAEEILHPTRLKHPTLCLYYDRVSTLREYLLDALPASSRSRRRKIAAVGLQLAKHGNNFPNGINRPTRTTASNPTNDSNELGHVLSKNEDGLRSLLDTTLVCTIPKDSRESDFASISQQGNPADDSFEGGASSISEVSHPRIIRPSLSSSPFQFQDIGYLNRQKSSKPQN